jgi:Na+/H+-translocating membrane pyrophosphatase
VAYNPVPWANFFIMTGGAAAALTGLLFVAMSLHAEAIMANRFYRSRAISTLMSLTTQLLLAAATLVPGQSLAALGFEALVAAVLFVGLSVTFLVWRRRHVPPYDLAVRRVAELISGLTLNATFVASAVSLLTRTGGGLYLLSVLMLLGFGWNIYVAWVLIAEVSE